MVGNTVASLAACLQDLRYACRSLWQAKAFTATAVCTLALGIAGTTVMFALIQGVLLRPLPVREQDRLILAWKTAKSEDSARYPFGNTEIDAVAEASRLLVSAAGVDRNGVGRTALSYDGVTAYANVGLITGAFFEVLGVQPFLGRTLTVADDREGAENVVVISHGLWQRRFGGAREVIGRRVSFDETPFTIVGVMPSDLDYPTGTEIWRTTHTVPTTGPFGDAARREVNLIGRLRDGASLEQGASEIAALHQRLSRGTDSQLVPVVRPFAAVVVGDVRGAMLTLFAAVGLVLLIACANVTNLLLMRGEARSVEMALRTALGAGTGRILLQVFAEALMLSVTAGIVAVGVAMASLQTLVAIVPDGLPRIESIRIDGTVVLFAMTVVFLTAVLASIAPAVLSLRRDVVSPLRRGAVSIAGGSSSFGRQALVVAQVALSVAVLAAAGMLIKSVLKLQAVDLGVNADRLVLVDLHVPDTFDRARHAQFLDAAIAAVETIPGVGAATPVNVLPFTGEGWDVPRFTVEGQDFDRAAANPSLNLESIHPNYFEAFQIPIERGRAFNQADREGAAEVAIVSADVAARAWPAEDPIGKRLKFGGPDSTSGWLTVVGVAARTRYRTVLGPRPTLYLPAAQFQMTATLLAVRSTAPLELLTSLVPNRLGPIAPDVRVMRVMPFADMLSRPLARPRFNAFLSSVFGGVALLLTAVGLYAVMAAYVRQRDREIALRMALGATASSIGATTAAAAARLTLLGVLVGTGCAIAGSRGLRAMLFEVQPSDPVSLAMAGALIVCVAACAVSIPLRRAIRIDIMAVLRH